MFSLKNKTIIITGASGHLGKEISKGLVKFGANLAICSTSKKKADNLSTGLSKAYNVKCNGYK